MEIYKTFQEKSVIERNLRKMGMEKSDDHPFYNLQTVQYSCTNRRFPLSVNVIDTKEGYHEIWIVGTILDQNFQDFVKKIKEKIPPSEQITMKV